MNMKDKKVFNEKITKKSRSFEKFAIRLIVLQRIHLKVSLAKNNQGVESIITILTLKHILNLFLWSGCI